MVLASLPWASVVMRGVPFDSNTTVASNNLDISLEIGITQDLQILSFLQAQRKY